MKSAARKGRGFTAFRRFMQVCVLLLVCAHAYAQGADLLHTIVDQLGQHSAVRAQFTQQRQNPALTQPQISKGRLLFAAGHGMLWDVQEPYQQTLVLTGGRAMRIDLHGQMQTERSEKGVSQIAQMLQGMMTGQLDAVKRQFDVRADGSASQWHLHFTPKQSRVAKVLRAIELDGGAYLQHIRIDMQDGTQTDIQMTDTRDAGPLSAQEKQVLGLP